MNLKQLFARIPEQLPADQSALEKFTKDLLAIYSLPDTGEYQRAVANAIQQATQCGSHKISKFSVYSFVRRAMAMRAAFLKLQELNKQEEKLKLAPKQESDVDGKEATQSPAG